MQEPEDGTLRTLLVGIDGVSMDVLAARPTDSIPTIRRIFEQGARSPLESQLPPWTPSAWPSLYTGVNPGKHGVFSFLKFDGYDWKVVNHGDVKEFSLWELLSQRGYSSVVVNVPVTHPSAAFDGALVPGYTAPEGASGHPPGLLQDLRAELGGYQVFGETGRDDPSAAKREYADLVRSRGEAFRTLVDRYDPAFGFLQFQQTDTVFHEHPNETDVVDSVFSAVDDEIEKTLQTTDPDVVFIVSDHGIGPYEGHEFRVNSFLRDHGYLETTAGTGGMPSWKSLAREQLRDESTGTASSLVVRGIRALSQVGLTSQRIARVATLVGLESTIRRIAPTDVIRAGTETVDFERSTAYFRDRIEMGIRINLAGREPDGVVERDEYETIRSTLIEALENVRTPDGSPVFDSVLPREDVFYGPYLDDAPDIVTVPDQFDQYLSASVRPEPFGPPSEPWNHKLHGVLAICGDVDVAAPIDGAHLLDIAPTVLATMGEPVSDRMDGRVLPVVEDPGVETYPVYEGELSETEGTAVEDHLADLGYIER